MTERKTRQISELRKRTNIRDLVMIEGKLPQIRELRKKAETELGDKFDIREFHEVILEQGTVTLSILESRINNFIERTKNE